MTGELPAIQPHHQEGLTSSSNPAFADIQRKGHERGQALTSPERIHELIEEPLIEPVTVLWDKNVPTFTASANAEEASAELGIFYDALSDNNKAVLDKMLQAEEGLPEDQRSTDITYPGDNDHDSSKRTKFLLRRPLEGETPESITAFYLDFANQMHEQSLSWAGQDEDFEKFGGFGYEMADDGKYYPSAELAAKQNAWLAAHPDDPTKPGVTA